MRPRRGGVIVTTDRLLTTPALSATPADAVTSATEQTSTAGRLAERLVLMADELDEAGAEAIADDRTRAARRYLMESLEAAERAAARLRDGAGSALAGCGSSP
jgi:hypothetical protein